MAAILTGIAPIIAFAHSYGPPPRVTAAAGDNPRACTSCHSGNALNSGQGSVKIVLQSGAVYQPGVKQRIAIQVADPNQRRWGFEFSARLNSDLLNGQAGDYTPVDNMTQVICEDATARPCAGVSFIEHTSVDTRNGTRNGVTFQFDWTPPATNAGPVTLYVAGNAANGDGALTGDFIYTANIQLNPVTAAAPTVTAGNIVSAATTVAGPLAANSWVTIYGSNLSATTRAWTDADFVDGAMPSALDGVSVVLTQFNAPRLAPIGYVSPTQVNFLLPSDSLSTATTLQFKNPAGTAAAVPITVQANAPQLFTADGKHVLCTHANGALTGSSAPAAPGETIVLYGTGLGATAPALIPGIVPAAFVGLATLPQVTIGGAAATVVSAGVPPNAAGLYQINVQVPADAANGDLAVIIRLGTASSASTLLTVQR
ncbi:MAG TPA: choice-of-anchor V domain-containing protein [Candidatus Solibacter sp.]